jgi:penicillin-insensitive murein DD-endopeptidase
MQAIWRTGLAVLAFGVCALATAASAQEGDAPAKQVFGFIMDPVPMEARAIGSYARGCLAGGRELPVNGPAWQAMRLSRNRNWGHPALLDYIERLARDAKAKDGWPGLLVGDLAQPRGGPMLTGHASHQIGLDADIWLKPMPQRRLSRAERERMSAVSMLAEDGLSVDRDVWTQDHVKLLRRAASYDEVARIFVHPAIKKALCRAASDERGWLRKIRPWWGHHYHFHVRLSCPDGYEGCRNQSPPPAGDGCGKPLDYWYRLLTAPPKPDKPRKKEAPMTLADLPAACQRVVGADMPPLGAPGAGVPVPMRRSGAAAQDGG